MLSAVNGASKTVFSSLDTWQDAFAVWQHWYELGVFD